MTHYSQDKCYHNTNDALSTDNSQLYINTTKNIYNYGDGETRSNAFAYDDFNISSEYNATNADMDWTRAGDDDGDGVISRTFNKNYITGYTNTNSTTDNQNFAGEYWEDNEFEDGRDIGCAKMPPPTPSSFIPNGCGATADEGTYIQRGSRFGVRLPAPPASTMMDSKYRMLPQTVAYPNVHTHRQHQYPNEHSSYAPIDERIGSFISLPATAPMRILPEPQKPNRPSQHIFEVDDSSAELPTATLCATSSYDVFCKISRPYTSMLPVDYTDYTDYGCNSDNLSTYSDTPPMSNAQQHKLQQQRKISLMMAMTTASVIASGETRVPARVQEQIHCEANNSSSTFSQTVAFSSAEASTQWSNSDAVATLTPPLSTTTRKLPKRLPSPQYKLTSALVLNNIPTSQSDLKNYRSKQLPKLPIPKSMANNPISGDIHAETVLPSTISTITDSDHKTTTPLALIATSCNDKNINVFPTTDGNQTFKQLCSEIQPSSIQSSYAIDATDNKSKDKTKNCNSTSSVTKNRSTESEVVLSSPLLQVLPSVLTLNNNQTSSKITTTTTTEAKLSVFDISEYLKPYTFDSLQLSTEINSDHNLYTTDRDKSSNLFTCFESDMPNLITTWTTTSPINNIRTTPLLNVDAVAPISTSKTICHTSSSTRSYILSDTLSVSHDTIVTPLSHFNNVFTTTTTPTVITSSQSTVATTACVTSVTSSPAAMLSYLEYMKRFELPELPPILDIYSNDNTNTIMPDIFTATTSAPTSISQSYSNRKGSGPIYMESTEPKADREQNALYDAFKTRSYEQIKNYPHESSDSLTADLNPIDAFLFSPDETQLGRTDVEVERNSSISLPTEEAPKSTVSAFDDSFYDSFNVDLSALTATMAHIECKTSLTPAIKPNNVTIDTTSIHSTNYTKIDLNETSNVGCSGQVSYYKPPQKQNQQTTLSITENPQKTKVVASAATNVLGGLSKGIKGGLDGVLSSVSSSMEVTNNTKKGFGLNLASKLVPNVGGLLSSSVNNKQHQQETVLTTSAILNTTLKSEPATQNSSIPYNYSMYEYDQLPEYMNTNATLHNMIDFNLEVSCPENDTHSQFNLDVDYYDSYNDDVDNSRMEALVFDDSYSYSSEYAADNPILLGGDGPVNIYECSEPFNAIAANEIEQGSSNQIAIHTVPSYNEYQNSMSNCSLLVPKTETNIETEINKLQQPLVTCKGQKKVAGGAGGGMLGSIFGKAAAAVQSATQAVNQGASSVASVVAQKTSIPSKDMPASNKITSNPDAHRDALTTAKVFREFPMDTDYIELVSGNQKTTVSNYIPTTGDDFENSNIRNGNNKEYSMYYSDSSQSQPRENISDTPAMGQQNVLPTVPSASGSTGKKLPTINGKTSLLIKQQPTEIFDDDHQSLNEELIDDEFLMQQKHIVKTTVGLVSPNYPIDSEQNDYYIDQQQTIPSSSLVQVANDYYEHVSTGYDYREDYFNEEDEYKYLEQQSQQQQQQHYQQQHQIKLSQKQLSLEYIMDDRQHDEFLLDDNYHSDEDCGNYLDESSSGSVGTGIAEGRKGSQKDDTSFLSIITNASSTSVHHQIKKQDSIIIEEGESTLDDDYGSEIRVVPAQGSPENKTDDDDQLADLMTIRSKSQKKKILMRGETEEVVSGHMQILRKPEITAKQRWHWAYNKIIMQLNVSNPLNLCLFPFKYVQLLRKGIIL